MNEIWLSVGCDDRASRSADTHWNSLIFKHITKQYVHGTAQWLSCHVKSPAETSYQTTASINTQNQINLVLQNGPKMSSSISPRHARGVSTGERSASVICTDTQTHKHTRAGCHPGTKNYHYVQITMAPLHHTVAGPEAGTRPICHRISMKFKPTRS